MALKYGLLPAPSTSQTGNSSKAEEPFLTPKTKALALKWRPEALATKSL